MNVSLTFNCKKGGLVKHGYDHHVRDDGAEILDLSFSRVPVIRESKGLHTPALIAHLKVVGFKIQEDSGIPTHHYTTIPFKTTISV